MAPPAIVSPLSCHSGLESLSRLRHSPTEPKRSYHHHRRYTPTYPRLPATSTAVRVSVRYRRMQKLSHTLLTFARADRLSFAQVWLDFCRGLVPVPALLTGHGGEGRWLCTQRPLSAGPLPPRDAADDAASSPPVNGRAPEHIARDTGGGQLLWPVPQYWYRYVQYCAVS